MISAILLGCGTRTAVFEDVQEAGALSYRHQIEAGDVLAIKVFGEEGLSGEFKANAEGHITYPFLGQMDVLGYTAEEVQDKIEIGLSNGYLVDPDVFVDIHTLKPIYVLGEVNKPGSYEYSADIDVIRAIALAQGFTHRAYKEEFKLIRGTGDKEQNLKASGKTPLHPGDVVVVKERFF